MRALITGGSRGIGAEIGRQFLESGMEVVVCSRTKPANEQFKWVEFNAEMDLHRKYAWEKIGYADILINNVGGGGRYGTNHEVWQKNVGTMVDFTQWALDWMLQKKWGRVITISSIHGKECGSRAVFMAAKAAQIAYMKGRSRDAALVRNGITFNTVCPGNVLVEGKPRVNEDALPMGRMGDVGEVARLVSFLCSNDASWINGSCITIDGGESCAF